MTKKIIHYFSLIIYAFIFGYAGFYKVIKVQAMVDGMTEMGFNANWTTFLGYVECAGVIGILIGIFYFRPLKNISILSLWPIAFGAFSAHIANGHMFNDFKESVIVMILPLFILGTDKEFRIKIGSYGVNKKIVSIDHVHIFVKNQYDSAKWFKDILGFEILEKYQAWVNGGPLSISADSGRSKIALFKKENPSNSDANLINTIALNVDGKLFMELFDKFTKSKVLNYQNNPIGVDDIVNHELAYSIYFLDMDYNRFELTTYDVDVVYRSLAM